MILIKALKNGNAIVLFDVFLYIWFGGVLIQHFRGSTWSVWFWALYFVAVVFAAFIVLALIASYALGVEEKTLRYSE
jgi:uncharacterized membrane protein